MKVMVVVSKPGPPPVVVKISAKIDNRKIISIISTTETALTVHLVMRAGHPGDAFLMQTCQTLRDTHGIGHTTMQVETDDATVCALAPAHVV